MRINRKKLVFLLKLIGILLSLSLVGFAAFYLVSDSYFWYIYLIFLVIGCVFVFLFFKKNKREKEELTFGKFVRQEEKDFKKIIDKVDEKEKHMEKKIEKKLFGK